MLINKKINLIFNILKYILNLMCSSLRCACNFFSTAAASLVLSFPIATLHLDNGIGLNNSAAPHSECSLMVKQPR